MQALQDCIGEAVVVEDAVKQNLSQLVTNQERSALRRLIDRRLCALLTKQCASETAADEKTLKAMGMHLIASELAELCLVFHRLVFVMAVSRE